MRQLAAVLGQPHHSHRMMISRRYRRGVGFDSDIARIRHYRRLTESANHLVVRNITGYIVSVNRCRYRPLIVAREKG
jgi:hypothetical protein